jgi:hypothetical protein
VRKWSWRLIGCEDDGFDGLAGLAKGIAVIGRADATGGLYGVRDAESACGAAAGIG